MRGDQTHPTWTTNLVDVRSTIETTITKLTVRDGNSMGINFVDCVNGKVSQSAAINLTDDTANGHYGYGVHSASSVGTMVNGFYAEHVRHAVDDNAVGLTSSSVNPSRYGADIGLTNAWAYQIVKHVGNYGEVFERNVGVDTPLKIARGINALWTKGGLQYAPPIR